MAKLAVFTYGILVEPEGHPQVQGFWDRADSNFEAVKQSDGFVARSGYDLGADPPSWGDHASPRFFADDEDDGDQAPRTLSIWEDLESIVAFAYSGVHAEALSRRREWFVKPEWPTYVAWWIADDHTPDWHEARARHEHLHDHGPSPFAFDFKHSFDPDGHPLEIDRALVRQKIEMNSSGS